MNYTLKNDQLSVTVDTFGAEMHSIQHDDIEYLWQADPKFWGRQIGRASCRERVFRAV